MIFNSLTLPPETERTSILLLTSVLHGCFLIENVSSTAIRLNFFSGFYYYFFILFNQNHMKTPKNNKHPYLSVGVLCRAEALEIEMK